MSEGNYLESERPMLQAIFQQNWENVRHIKNERLMFTNIYAVITAGTLSFLNSVKGEGRVEIFLIIFLWFLSLIGLLTSLRLKAELHECLENIERLLVHLKLGDYMAMGATKNARMRFPKFRWVFPIFFAFTTAAFSMLLIYRLFIIRVF